MADGVDPFGKMGSRGFLLHELHLMTEAHRIIQKNIASCREDIRLIIMKCDSVNKDNESYHRGLKYIINLFRTKLADHNWDLDKIKIESDNYLSEDDAKSLDLWNIDKLIEKEIYSPFSEDLFANINKKTSSLKKIPPPAPAVDSNIIHTHGSSSKGKEPYSRISKNYEHHEKSDRNQPRPPSPPCDRRSPNRRSSKYDYSVNRKRPYPEPTSRGFRREIEMKRTKICKFEAKKKTLLKEIYDENKYDHRRHSNQSQNERTSRKLTPPADNSWYKDRNKYNSENTKERIHSSYTPSDPRYSQRYECDETQKRHSNASRNDERLQALSSETSREMSANRNASRKLDHDDFKKRNEDLKSIETYPESDFDIDMRHRYEKIKHKLPINITSSCTTESDVPYSNPNVLFNSLKKSNNLFCEKNESLTTSNDPTMTHKNYCIRENINDKLINKSIDKDDVEDGQIFDTESRERDSVLKIRVRKTDVDEKIDLKNKKTCDTLIVASKKYAKVNVTTLSLPLIDDKTENVESKTLESDASINPIFREDMFDNTSVAEINESIADKIIDNSKLINNAVYKKTEDSSECIKNYANLESMETNKTSIAMDLDPILDETHGDERLENQMEALGTVLDKKDGDEQLEDQTQAMDTNPNILHPVLYKKDSKERLEDKTRVMDTDPNILHPVLYKKDNKERLEDQTRVMDTDPNILHTVLDKKDNKERLEDQTRVMDTDPNILHTVLDKKDNKERLEDQTRVMDTDPNILHTVLDKKDSKERLEDQTRVMDTDPIIPHTVLDKKDHNERLEDQTRAIVTDLNIPHSVRVSFSPNKTDSDVKFTDKSISNPSKSIASTLLTNALIKTKRPKTTDKKSNKTESKAETKTKSKSKPVKKKMDIKSASPIISKFINTNLDHESTVDPAQEDVTQLQAPPSPIIPHPILNKKNRDEWLEDQSQAMDTDPIIPHHVFDKKYRNERLEDQGQAVNTDLIIPHPVLDKKDDDEQLENQTQAIVTDPCIPHPVLDKKDDDEQLENQMQAMDTDPYIPHPLLDKKDGNDEQTEVPHNNDQVENIESLNNLSLRILNKSKTDEESIIEESPKILEMAETESDLNIVNKSVDLDISLSFVNPSVDKLSIGNTTLNEAVTEIFNTTDDKEHDFDKIESYVNKSIHEKMILDSEIICKNRLDSIDSSYDAGELMIVEESDYDKSDAECINENVTKAKETDVSFDIKLKENCNKNVKNINKNDCSSIDARIPDKSVISHSTIPQEPKKPTVRLSKRKNSVPSKFNLEENRSSTDSIKCPPPKSPLETPENVIKSTPTVVINRLSTDISSPNNNLQEQSTVNKFKKSRNKIDELFFETKKHEKIIPDILISKKSNADENAKPRTSLKTLPRITPTNAVEKNLLNKSKSSDNEMSSKITPMNYITLRKNVRISFSPNKSDTDVKVVDKNVSNPSKSIASTLLTKASLKTISPKTTDKKSSKTESKTKSKSKSVKKKLDIKSASPIISKFIDANLDHKSTVDPDQEDVTLLQAPPSPIISIPKTIAMDFTKNKLKSNLSVSSKDHSPIVSVKETFTKIKCTATAKTNEIESKNVNSLSNISVNVSASNVTITPKSKSIQPKCTTTRIDKNTVNMTVHRRKNKIIRS